jgi:hypothetical protein
MVMMLYYYFPLERLENAHLHSYCRSTKIRLVWLRPVAWWQIILVVLLLNNITNEASLRGLMNEWWKWMMTRQNVLRTHIHWSSRAYYNIKSVCICVAALAGGMLFCRLINRNGKREWKPTFLYDEHCPQSRREDQSTRLMQMRRR